MDRKMDIVIETPSTASLNGMPYKGAHYIHQVKGATIHHTRRVKHKPKTVVIHVVMPKKIARIVQVTGKEPYKWLVPPHNYTIDPLTTFVIPLIIVSTMIFLFFKLLIRSLRKNPVHGSYAHQHRRLHPGVPKPHIFK